MQVPVALTYCPLRNHDHYTDVRFIDRTILWQVHSGARTPHSALDRLVSTSVSLIDWIPAKNGLGGVLRRKGSKSGSNPSWNKGCLLLCGVVATALNQLLKLKLPKLRKGDRYYLWWLNERRVQSGRGSWILGHCRRRFGTNFSTVFVFAFPFPLVLSHTCQSIVHTPQQFLRCTAAGFILFFSASAISLLCRCCCCCLTTHIARSLNLN